MTEATEGKTPAPATPARPAAQADAPAGRSAGYHTEIWAPDTAAATTYVCDDCPFDSSDEASIQTHVQTHGASNEPAPEARR